MPNHVLNELVFHDVSGAEQARIITALCGEIGSCVDFQTLVPIPANVWQFNVGSQHDEAFKRTALDWCRDNWGTKWNAYSHKPIERTDASVTFIFETAWRPPYGWLAAVFNTLKRGFDHNWIDEGGPCKIGIFRWPSDDDGILFEAWLERDPTDEEKCRLHKMSWGVEGEPTP